MAGFLLVLVGCQVQRQPRYFDVGSADPPADTGNPFASEHAPDAPDWTAEEALEALARSLAEGLPDVGAIVGTYDLAMELRDDDCPTRLIAPADAADAHGPWAAQDCVSDLGGIFDGEVSDLDEGATRKLGGSGSISTADGLVHSHTGAAERTCNDDGTWSALVSGNFASPGGEGWHARGGRASAFFEGTATSLRAFGGFEGEGGFVHLDDLALGETCVGGVWIEDPTGWWWRLAVHDCGGCGYLWWEDARYGQACAPLDAMYALVEGACT